MWTVFLFLLVVAPFLQRCFLTCPWHVEVYSCYDYRPATPCVFSHHSPRERTHNYAIVQNHHWRLNLDLLQQYKKEKPLVICRCLRKCIVKCGDPTLLISFLSFFSRTPTCLNWSVDLTWTWYSTIFSCFDNPKLQTLLDISFYIYSLIYFLKTTTLKSIFQTFVPQYNYNGRNTVYLYYNRQALCRWKICVFMLCVLVSGWLSG